jgi:hypothetical protein
MTPIQLKILRLVYAGTDCCNEVYDYAKLHRTQDHIAADLVALGYLTFERCIAVDGDGFHIDPERWGWGYRLTLAGYEALTESAPTAYPPKFRRFAALAEQEAADA